MTYRMVAPRYGMRLQLFGDTVVRKIILTSDHGTRGIHVDSVNDSWAHDAIDAGQAASAMIHQGIHQCPAVMPGSGVYHHSLGFVYHYYIIIFIKYVQRYGFRCDIRLYRLWQSEDNVVFCPDTIASLHRLPVYIYRTILDHFLYKRARQRIDKHG